MHCAIVINEDSGERFEASEEHAGREVRDVSGRTLGTVESVFVGEDGEPACVRARIAASGESVLLPAASVTVARG